MTPIDDRRSERFGRYEILAELGRGAMGVVYKARDPKINRVVAVKTVSLAGQAPEEELEYRERFFREAEAAGRLSHPGIVTIFDVGEEPETRAPYIVMEFIGGQSLDKLLSRHDDKLPLEAALQLALELAEALDCAHGQGVVHRDLKPANILLTDDGHAKIADFGVAKLNRAPHTPTGRAFGTPAYMSPEQLNGEEVDGRSDLFSLGVVLYTVLTGYRPFQGNSAVTVSFKVVNREPMPATLLDTELPQGLDYIIARAMAKNPAERYQRGMEMVLDIQELQEGREPWSKSKLPGSPTDAGAGQTLMERAKATLGKSGIAANILLSTRPLPRRHATGKNLLETIQKKSFVGALLLVGLLVFGLWFASFRPSRLRPRVAEPRLPAGEVDPVKTAAMPTAPAGSSVAAVATAPTPTAKSVKVADTGSLVSPATLDIEVEHNFAAAHLSVWVDDHSIYTHLTEGTDKKRLVVFHDVQGHESHAMQLAPGKHRVRVRMVSGADTYDQSGTVVGTFASGKEKVLRIHFNKHGAMNLSLQ
jgi:serine/threonine protein kinase